MNNEHLNINCRNPFCLIVSKSTPAFSFFVELTFKIPPLFGYGVVIVITSNQIDDITMTSKNISTTMHADTVLLTLRSPSPPHQVNWHLSPDAHT